MSSTQTHQAAVLEEKGEPLVLKTVPIPPAVHGSAVIKVLAALVSPLSKTVLGKHFPLPLSTPVTPSTAAIGRIHAVGPDATMLKEGQLVLADFWQRSRDNTDDSILQGYMGGVENLEKVYNNGAFAEYAQVSLECIVALNEDFMVNKLGYSITDLAYLGTLCIPLAGLMDIDTRPGDTLIVAPATGYFGGSAVAAGLGMGARVIAVGRNADTLSRLSKTFGSTGRLTTVKLTGDVDKDTEAIKKASGSSKGADRYIDFSPPQAANSNHMVACLSALRPHGKCVIMGAIFGTVSIPYALVMRNNLSIQGRYMFDHHHAEQTLKLVEAGHMKLGAGEGCGATTHSFKLDDVNVAMDKAEELSGWGNVVVLQP